MRLHSIPTKIWLQQALLWALLTVLLFGLVMLRPRTSLARISLPIVVFGFSTLGLTFLDPGLQGVHRYFQIAGFRLSAGEMVLPSVIMALGYWQDLNRRYLHFLALVTLIILLAQPDAGRVTAFSAAAAFLFDTTSRRETVVKNVLLFAAVALAWGRADPLGKVAYAEDIVRLAKEASPGWGLAAFASLAVLPVPFILAAVRSRHRTLAALAAYFVCSIIVPFLGNFPVPVLGYGASGMIGYFSGLLAVVMRHPAGAVSPRACSSQSFAVSNSPGADA